MTNTFIISDIKLYREGLRDYLKDIDAINVVGAIGSVDRFIDEVVSHKMGIVILDMTMLASCESLALLTSKHPNLKVIAFAVSEEDEATIVTCAKHGIAGCVLRDSSLDQLVSVIRAVDRGEVCYPRRVAASLIQKLRVTPDSGSLPPVTSSSHRSDSVTSSLTARERQIAELVFDGMSNKQIANHLTIEVSTVKNHVHKILNKMGVQSRTQMASLLHHATSPV